MTEELKHTLFRDALGLIGVIECEVFGRGQDQETDFERLAGIEERIFNFRRFYGMKFQDLYSDQDPHRKPVEPILAPGEK